MKVALIAPEDVAARLALGLVEEGIEAVRIATGGAPAAALRAVESALGELRPDAVLVAGDGDGELMGALVAAKGSLPWAAAATDGEPAPGSNARLIALLAPASPAAEPGAVAAWARGATATAAPANASGAVGPRP